MDIRIYGSQQLPLVLGALRRVAVANDRLTTAEAQFLEGLALLHGAPLRAEELPDTSPVELSRVLANPHLRKRAVQLAIVMSLVEGQPAEASVTAVRDLAQALEVPEDGLRVLDRVAHEHAMLARLDMVRRVQRFAKSNDGPNFLRVAVSMLLGLGADSKLAARYSALADLPKGTLGRALYEHYRAHDFALPGEKGGLPELMLFHDVGHVVSGYGVDPQSEIQQAAFQAGFARTDGFVFLLFGILQFHLGLRITPVAQGQHGLFDVPRVLTALARGAACQMDFSNHFDFFGHAAEELETLRARWGVPALSS
jgi:hypothetical protein